jgi:hypothetical protein
MSFFHEVFFKLSIVLLVFTFIFSVSCERQNNNDVGCFLDDCIAACKTKGFPAGQCQNDVCSCTAADTNPYPWEEIGTDTDTDTDVDTDTDTDTDTDSDIDTDTDTDTDTNPVPDSGQ